MDHFVLKFISVGVVQFSMYSLLVVVHVSATLYSNILGLLELFTA